MIKNPKNIWAWVLSFGGALVILAPVTASFDLKQAASQFLGLGALLAFGLWLLLSGRFLFSFQPRGGFNRAMLAYFTCLILSWLLSPYKSAGFSDVFAQVSWMLAGLGAALLPPNSGQRSLLLKCWLAASGLVAIYALAQRLGLDPVAVYVQAGSRERAMSVFGNPTFFAGFLVLAWPLALAMPSKGWLLLIPLMWMALGATQSRAGLLALVAQFLLIIIGVYLETGFPPSGTEAGTPSVHNRTRGRLVAVILATMAVLAAGFWLFLPASMWTRPTLRWQLWIATWDLIVQRPLLGWGPGSFVLGFGENIASNLKAALDATNQFAEHPHNFILSLLWEGGFLLLTAFGAIVYFAAKAGWAKFKTSPDPESRVFNAALLLGLTGLLVQNLFDRNLKLAGSGFFLWVFLGWMSVENRHGDAETRGHGEYWMRFLGAALITLACAGLWQAARPLQAYFAVKAEPDALSKGRGQAPQDEQGLKKALIAAPKDPLLWQALGDALAKQSRFPEAGQAYEKCVQLDSKNVGALINLGNCCFQAGQLDQARQTFQQAASLEPGNVDAHFNLGYTYYYQRKMKEAVAEFDTVLKLQPGHAKALIMKEQILH